MKKKNNLIAWVAAALVVGGIIGFLLGSSNQIFSRSYMQETTDMMGYAGQSMVKTGEMMAGMGQMMWQKGNAYNDTDMMQRGKSLEASGIDLYAIGSNVLQRSSGMMGRMP